MRKSRILNWLCVATLLIMLLSGCSSGRRSVLLDAGKAAPPRPDKQEIALNLGAPPPDLDTSTAISEAAFAVLNQVCEGLVRPGEGGKVDQGSGQAAGWKVSDDGLTYTFTLKDGLQWSDGKPVTAGDFVYAWLRALDPKTASQYNYQLFYIKGGEAWGSLDPKAADFGQKYAALKRDVAIKALDDKRFEVKLERPTPYFINLTALPTYFPVRQDLVEKYGDTYATDSNKLGFNGPFVMESWQHETQLVLAKNEAYWDRDQVRLEKVTFTFIRDAHAAVTMYAADQLDTVALPGSLLDAYKDKPGVHREATATAWYLEFNLNNNKKAYLQNAHIRRAISLALDRQTFVDRVLKNGSLPATGLVPPTIHIGGQSYRKVAGDLLPAQADVAQAQRELAAGLKDLGLDKLPDLDFLISPSEQAQTYAQGIQGMVQQNLPGSMLNLVPVELKVQLDRMRHGDFDIVLAGWSADYDDPMTFLDMWVSGGPYNDPHWSNGDYDQFVATARTSLDAGTRTQAFALAEKVLMKEIPIVPLYWPANNAIRKPWLKGMLVFSVGADLDLKSVFVEGRNAAQ